MNKVKEFYKKHETEIKIVAGVTCFALVGYTGYLIGYKTGGGNRYWIPDCMMKVLTEAKKEFPKTFCCYTRYDGDLISASELGMIGRYIAKQDANPSFKYIIAIGPECSDLNG